MIRTQQVAERCTQFRPTFTAARHQRVERRRRTGLSHSHRQQILASAQVQNLISYGDTDRRRIRTRKNAEGQILNRECIASAIRRRHPALTPRIMCSIHSCINEWAFP